MKLPVSIDNILFWSKDGIKLWKGVSQPIGELSIAEVETLNRLIGGLHYQVQSVVWCYKIALWNGGVGTALANEVNPNNVITWAIGVLIVFISGLLK